MSLLAFLRGRLTSRAQLPALFGVVAGALIAGCQPKIGDSCTTSIDCSQTGSRLCDSSQPNGYCTIFNCEPDKCPDNSVCVGFGNEVDPVCGGIFDPRWSRFERTFCMKACETSSDCRDGYVCAAPADRRSTSIDILSDWKDFKVCFPALTEPVPQIDPPPACYDTTVAAGTGSGPSSSSASTGTGMGGAAPTGSTSSGASSTGTGTGTGTGSGSTGSGGGAGGGSGN